MEEKNKKLLTELKRKSIMTTGGAIAVSVAYSVAYAKRQAKGELTKIQLTLDSSIFKNGLNVMIPGCDERGLDFAAALGYVHGHEEEKLQMLSSYGMDEVRQAKELLSQGRISIRVKDDCDRLYIETMIESSENAVRILILDFHLNVIFEETAKTAAELIGYQGEYGLNCIRDEHMGLDDFLRFTEQVDIEDLDFIAEGLGYNLKLVNADEHESLTAGYVRALKRYGIEEDIVTYPQMLCMRACENRIRGAKLPIMTAVGSANYGISCYLANYGVAERLGVPREKLIRAVALANLMCLYVNSYIGTNAAVCDCGLAVGVGVAVSTAYLLGADYDAMERAAKNMLGSVTGIICEGSGLKCAWKIGLSVAWAIKSAILSIESEDTENEGFLDNSLDRIMETIAEIYNPLSNTINQTISGILMEKTYD